MTETIKKNETYTLDCLKTVWPSSLYKNDHSEDLKQTIFRAKKCSLIIQYGENKTNTLLEAFVAHKK